MGTRQQDPVIGAQDLPERHDAVVECIAQCEQALGALKGFDETTYTSSSRRVEEWRAVATLRDLVDETYWDVRGRIEQGELDVEYPARVAMDEQYDELLEEFDRVKESYML
jgi:hypothetical protein